MTRRDKLRDKILNGDRKSIKYSELVRFLIQSGWTKRKAKSGTSHEFFEKESVSDVLNLQPTKNGEAKPYQVDLVRKTFKTFKL